MISSEDQPDYDGAPVRQPKREPFSITPKALRQFVRDRRDGDITQVYATLAEYANADGVCWPSQATIATESGVSLRKVVTILNLLHEAGFIRSERGQHRNMYTILTTPTVQDMHTEESSTVQDLHPTVQNLHVTVQETTPHCADSAHITRTSEPEPVEQDSVEREYIPRANEIARWFAKRVGGLVPKPGSKEWLNAQALAEANAADADLDGEFVWLQSQSWVKSVSLTLMAGKYNEYRSTQAPKQSPQANTTADRLAYLRAGKFTGNDHVMYVSGFNAKENLARDIAALEGGR